MKLPCHCCETLPGTPHATRNRASLSAIAYRIGTYSAFRSSMLANISRHPELANLTTRASDDYAIALMELWAAVADVLTFYQERYANEAYLRTATFTESVKRLAALIGYRPTPGVAARAWVAFTAEGSNPIPILAGQQVQSVPGEGEQPQKFETLHDLTAWPALSRLRVFPSPIAVNPLAASSPVALLDLATGPAVASPLSPGQTVVLFNNGSANPAEEKKIAAVVKLDHGVLLQWDRAIQKDTWTSATRAYRYRRTLRLFGHNAPASYVRPDPDPENPTDATKIIWSLRSVASWGLSAGNHLHLDGRFEDLQVGQRLLIADGGSGGVKTLVTIRQVEQVAATFGSLTETVTRLEVTSFPALADRRSVAIYELVGNRILLSPIGYAPSITGDALYLPGMARRRDGELGVEVGRTIEGSSFKPGQVVLPQDIEEGRTLLLDDAGSEDPVVATVKATPTIEPADAAEGSFCHLRIQVDTAAPLALAALTATLQGNVARASHGETVNGEVVGNTDGSKPFQRLELKKRPLTYLPAASAAGVENTLELKVGGVEWQEVSELFGAGPTDHVYELRHDDEGDAWLQFGDGVHGAIPPTGSGSVIADYRYGSGLVGRVPRASLTTLLRKPPGLLSATNPLAAEGGADPETLETSRLNAPRGVRTFGRIVSLQDFEDQVTLSGEVAKALATAVWDGRDVAIHLTVAGQAGATFTDEALRELGNNLATVRDPNHRLRLGNYREIHVQLRGGVGVEPGHDPDEVVENARQAVIAALSFDTVSLGQSVAASDMYRVIQDVPGVRFVDIDWFMYKLSSLGTSFWSVLFELWRRRVSLTAAGLAPVQDRLRLFYAHPDPAHPGQVLPAELPAIDNPDEDVILEPRALP